MLWDYKMSSKIFFSYVKQITEVIIVHFVEVFEDSVFMGSSFYCAHKR